MIIASIFIVSSAIFASILTVVPYHLEIDAEDDLPILSILAAAFLGAIFGEMSGYGAPGIAPLCCAILAAAAWLDRERSWVPDITALAMIFAITCLSAMVQSTELHHAVIYGFAGISFYVAYGLLYDRVCEVFGPAPTPIDVLTLMAPVLIFGPSLMTLYTYLVIGACLVAIRRIPPLKSIFSNGAASEQAARDLDIEDGTPLLPTVFPSILGGLPISSQFVSSPNISIFGIS